MFIIIVLGFIALWLLLSDSNSLPAVPEDYPSGATALDSTTTLAGSGVAGPLPEDPSDMIYAPRTPMANARVPNGRQEENFVNQYTVKFLSDIFS